VLICRNQISISGSHAMSAGQHDRTYGEPVSIGVFDDSELALLARLARKSVFEICQIAGHGHIGGSSSAAELLVSLYFGGALRFNPSDPNDHRRDRVLVRGHLGPLRYKLFSWLDWIDESELSGYRRLASRLHGHEDHLATPGVDITPSGSLGMLLSYGVGCALAARDMSQGYRTWVFLGDGEEQEGMIGEAARHAAHLHLNQIVVVIDRNGKQLSNPTRECDSSDLAQIWSGYGWHVEEIKNGHDVREILHAFSVAVENAQNTSMPTAIIANTKKGLGLNGADDHYSGYHTISRVSAETVEVAIATISRSIPEQESHAVQDKLRALTGRTQSAPTSQSWQPMDFKTRVQSTTPNNPDTCQRDYFQLLQKSPMLSLFKRDGSYFLTADVTTREAVTELGARILFEFHNVGLREQHLIAMAHGISISRPATRIFINSLDAFTYRCMDQINAALQGGSHFVIVGDVSGLTNSRNGRTHQTTGLPAALLAMNKLTFLEPWDAVDAFACLDWALGQSRGLVYVRVHSSTMRFASDSSDERSLSYYRVKDGGKEPDIVLIGSGLTVDSCLEASELLARDNRLARVINIVNPNALDAGFADLIPDGKPVLIAYNGDKCVLDRIVSANLVRFARRPGRVESVGYSDGATGTLDELLSHFGLDGKGVHRSARALLY
jgi:transketolase